MMGTRVASAHTRKLRISPSQFSLSW